MAYSENKIKDFLERLSSTDSMPGGGVAVALTAANGVALTLKVCNLSIGKEKYKAHQETIISAKEKSEKLLGKFLELMDKDAENFKVMEDVFAMPNTTDEEKRDRKEAMQMACKICCTVPRELMTEVANAIVITDSVVGKSSVSAASDLNVAINLLIASFKGAWENIAINLKYIDDKKFIDEEKNYMKQQMLKIKEKFDLIDT